MTGRPARRHHQLPWPVAEPTEQRRCHVCLVINSDGSFLSRRSKALPSPLRHPGLDPGSMPPRFRRRGGWLSVYPHGLAYLLSRAGRRTDIVVDVHNGIPFAAPLVRRRRLHVLVHHVHREQWQIIYPGVRGRIGWWVESRLAPRLYRGIPYITVSQSSKRDLAGLGIEEGRISVVCNGIDVPHPSRLQPRSPSPRRCVPSRPREAGCRHRRRSPCTCRVWRRGSSCSSRRSRRTAATRRRTRSAPSRSTSPARR